MKLFILSLLALLLLGSTFLYQQNITFTEEEETISKRSFFKKWNRKSHPRFNNSTKLQSSDVEEDVPAIVTYGLNFKLEVDNQNRSENIDEVNTDVKVTAQCDVQTIYDEDLNMFEVAVSYTMINKNNESNDEEVEPKLSEEQDVDEENYRDEEVEDLGNFETEEVQNLFYIVQVGADSGEVLSLQIEKGQDEDVIMTYATQQLINDIFPEMRRGSYSKGAIESDNLGEVHVDYVKEDIDENNIAITKEFKSEDYVQLEVPELGTPEINYERISLVEKDSGLVQEGMTDYTFTLGEVNAEGEVKLSSADGEAKQEDVEALGQISGEMVSSFWIIDPTEKDQFIAKEMYRYRNTAEFEPKRLAKEMKAEIEFGNGKEEEFELEDFDVDAEVIEVDDDNLMNTDKPNVEYIQEHHYIQSEENSSNPETESESQKLSIGRQTFREVKELGSVKILGKKIAVDFIYTGYTDVSDIAVKAKVGNHYIANIVSARFNNCRPSNNQSHQSKKYTFFKATFPILGIIVVPVSASGVFNYGYTTSVNTGPRYCAFNFSPYMNVGLYADGQVSLAGLISAGIYAQGNFLNSRLTLSAVSQAGRSTSSLTGQFHGINFEMGATYTKISCSLKNLKSSLPAPEQEEEDIFEEMQQRRNLGLRKKFKKVKKAVKKVVHKAKPIVKQVAKVANRAYNIATNLHKICSKSKGSVLIAKTNSKAHNKTLWSKSVNFGI